MNLNQLYYFQKVAQLQHYHQAATALNISQPSLSRSIANLEDELGIPLFKKNGRNIKLTKYGQIFLEHVNRILEEIKVAETKMKALSNASGGHIDIGYVFPLAKSYIPHMVRNFLNTEQNKDVTFSLNQDITKKLISGLKSEKYDIIFGSYVPDEPEIEFIPIINQEMVIITPVGHPLKNKKPIILEDLLDYPVIGYDHTSGLGRFTNSIYRQNHMKPSIAFETPDENAIASLVAENFGIGFVAHVESLRDYNVEILHLANVKPYHTVYMAYLKNSIMLPSVQNFIDFVKKTIDRFY
ncbi:LysR family transcriptional regulator [Anaerostipes sp.]|uniref:LysR family transcriptional regulator n=1 Tax=Anaerostipes sp. TaxID=1872530 RepID=UPI00258AA960|nr:LysR family transcriptional regulator [Anaerostipes sp.]MCI5624145.1 LysR family transcriptional regulator [Anaerostipes sp.]MDY2727184.1 LysR family transcriptional regulator [Anaerostipes faecalis]